MLSMVNDLSFRSTPEKGRQSCDIKVPQNESPVGRVPKCGMAFWLVFCHFWAQLLHKPAWEICTKRGRVRAKTAKERATSTLPWVQ